MRSVLHRTAARVGKRLFARGDDASLTLHKSAWVAGSVAVAASFGLSHSVVHNREKMGYPKGFPKGHVARADLPTFSIAEVKKHTDQKSGVWVTYKGGVYDVTSLIAGHPGGNGRLLMAGGNDISIFWDIYRQHYQKHIIDFTETYRIGNLSPTDAIKMETEFVASDPYETDPERPNPDFLHTTEKPFCGEPLLGRLHEAFYTPNDLHYVRLHMPVPDIDVDDWRLTVKGIGVREREFTLKELQDKFKHHTVACTLQCAGNRREDFQNFDGNAVFISPQWRVAAISNAKYKGVRVRDVLQACGLDVEGLHTQEKPHPTIRHIHYEGTDVTEDGQTYGISIPIEKAVDPRGDCMIVWEMNDEPLPKDHGGPVRTLTPGHVGNKSCKFLENIIVESKESPKPWHAKSYRNFPPDVSFQEHLSKWDKLTPDQLAKGPICQLMPVQSLITYPPPNSVIGGRNAKTIEVQGVAWTGNGTGMARVDLSLDGGKSWTAADFKPKPKDVAEREAWGRMWSWSLFEKRLPLPEELQQKLRDGKEVSLELVSKGVDNCFNVQPESVGPFINPRGVVVNSMYRVPVSMDAKSRVGYFQGPQGQDAFNPPTGGHFLRTWNEHGWASPEAKRHTEIVAEAAKPRRK